MDEATRNLQIEGEQVEKLGLGQLPRFYRLNQLRECNPSRKTKRCPRYYLTGNPHMENTIVGAALKKNFEKLCEQCKQSPMCRRKEVCEHCVRYCGPYATEWTGEDESTEDVGIAREPENDFTQREAIKDMTLVSRTADGNEMSERMNEDENLDRDEPSTHLQMAHESLSNQKKDGKATLGNNRDIGEEKEETVGQEHPTGRYYSVGIINPGLLMNTMLKLINIKKTPEMEQAIILVKSRKPLPWMIEIPGGNIDSEFLKMLGRELETAEKIHGKFPIDAREINGILQTAYEKAEFESKSEAQIDKTSGHEENYNKKMKTNDVTASKMDIEPQQSVEYEHINQSPPVSARNIFQQKGENLKATLDEMGDAEQNESLEENDGARTLHHKKHKKKNKKQMQSYSHILDTHQYSPYSYSRGNDDQSEQDRERIPNEDFREEVSGALQESLRPLNEDSIGVNDEFEISPKSSFKGQGESPNDRTQSQETRNNENLIGSQQQILASTNENMVITDNNIGNNQKSRTNVNKDNIEPLSEMNGKVIGSQQERFSSPNEDNSSAKDYLERDQKISPYKGLGERFNNHVKSQIMENNGNMKKTKQESEMSVDIDSSINEDIIRSNSDMNTNKDSSYHRDSGMAEIHLTEHNKKLNPQKVSFAKPGQDSHHGMHDPLHSKVHGHFNKVQKYFNKHSGRESQKSDSKVGMTESINLQNQKDDGIMPDIELNTKNNEEKTEGSKAFQLETTNNNPASRHGMLSEMKASDFKDEAMGIQNVGVQFQPEDLINLQMTNENGNEKKTENTGKEGSYNGLQDLIIPEEKSESDLKKSNMKSEKSLSPMRNRERITRTESAENSETEIIGSLLPNENDINGEMNDLRNQMNVPQYTGGEKNLPGQKIMQVDDQLIDIPDEEALIFHVNNQAQASTTNGNAQEQDDVFINQPSVFEDEKLGVMKVIPTENPMRKQMILSDHLSQNLGLSKTEPSSVIKKHPLLPSLALNEEEEFRPPKIGYSPDGENERSAKQENRDMINGEVEFPIAKGNSMTKNLIAPAFSGSQHPEIIQNVKSLSTPADQEIPNQHIALVTPKTRPTKINAPAPAFGGSQSSRIILAPEQEAKLSAATEDQLMSNEELTLPKSDSSSTEIYSPSPTIVGSQISKIMQTEEERSKLSASTGEREKLTNLPSQTRAGFVDVYRKKYENAIEEKIDKLITPREQEFLQNFGKIVPAIEKMNINYKSDIYFMGNGIKLPLKMSPNNDGSISLSVDVEKLCKCKNSTCADKIDMISKLDGNLMEMSNDLPNPDLTSTVKDENDNNLSLTENTIEKKVRKPRNYMDASELYKTYNKKYHRLHTRSVTNEYFKRYREIQEDLEKKLNELNVNVKKSNEEHNNMLIKGTKELLQIKAEDQVVKHRIELVNDLLQWMKKMASEVTYAEDQKLI